MYSCGGSCIAVKGHVWQCMGVYGHVFLFIFTIEIFRSCLYRVK